MDIDIYIIRTEAINLESTSSSPALLLASFSLAFHIQTKVNHIYCQIVENLAMVSILSCINYETSVMRYGNYMASIQIKKLIK